MSDISLPYSLAVNVEMHGIREERGSMGQLLTLILRVFLLEGRAEFIEKRGMRRKIIKSRMPRIRTQGPSLPNYFDASYGRLVTKSQRFCDNKGLYRDHSVSYPCPLVGAD